MNKSPLLLALFWSLTRPVNGNPISLDKTRYRNPPANYNPQQPAEIVDNRYIYENQQQQIGQMQYYPQQPCPQCMPMDLSSQYQFVPYENDPRSDPNAQYQYYPVNNYQNHESNQPNCLECQLLDENQQQPVINNNNQNTQLFENFQAPVEEVPSINQALESNHKCPVCGSENTPMLRMYLFSMKPNGQEENCQYGLVLNGKEDSNGQSSGYGLDRGQTDGSQDNKKLIEMATAAITAPGTQNLNPNTDMTQLNPDLKTNPPVQNVNLNIEVYTNSATTRISPKSTPSPIITTEEPTSTTVTQIPAINSTTTTKPENVGTPANNTEIVGSTRKIGNPSERSVNLDKKSILSKGSKAQRVSLPRLRSSRSQLNSLTVHPNYSHTRKQGSSHNQS